MIRFYGYEFDPRLAFNIEVMGFTTGSSQDVVFRLKFRSFYMSEARCLGRDWKVQSEEDEGLAHVRRAEITADAQWNADR